MGTDTRRERNVQVHPAQIRKLGLSAADLARARPVYRHIARVLERAIGSGAITPGLRLPPERTLALALQVSRETIVKAYRELETKGLVRGHVGRGTYVAAAPDTSGAPFAWRGKIAAGALRTSDSTIRDLVHKSIDGPWLAVGAGMPTLECFPTAAFQHALEHVLQRDLRLVWGHAPTEGVPVCREVIASRFGGQPENVLVLAGAQQGLDLLARCLLDPGDAVVVDRPGYPGAIQTFRSAGAKLIGWDVVRHDLDELEDLIRRYRPKFVYTNPTFQNPTGWSMPLKLRQGLLSLAGRLRVPIVEDDTYRELTFGAPSPQTLFGMDTQSLVIHLRSFSKVLAPGLRLGWLTAAEPIVDQLAQIKQRADPHTQTLVQLVVSGLIQNGRFDEHMAALREEHLRRRDALAEALRRQCHGSLQFAMPAGGLYFWCRLSARVSATSVLARASREGVDFVPGQPFYADRAGDRDLRLCFTSVATQHADAVARVLARSIATVRRETAGATALRALG